MAKNGGLLDGQKNSVSSSIISQNQYQNLPSNRLMSGHTQIYPTDPDGKDSSFSYLPSIHGVYRNKMSSGASADMMASRKRNGGQYSRTGK